MTFVSVPVPNVPGASVAAARLLAYRAKRFPGAHAARLGAFAASRLGSFRHASAAGSLRYTSQIAFAAAGRL